MNILLANDDGITARGIHELANALHRELGAVIYVFAPDSQRSGASHAISLRTPITARKVQFENAETAYEISGTPADCVAIGLKILAKDGIRADLVFAGINHGSNVGTDTIYSGTVGAAMEGSIQGVPSVAVSVDSHQAEYFEYACDLAVDTVRKTGGKWDKDVMININTPNLPKSDIKGVEYTTIGERRYDNDVQVERVDGETTVYSYGGEAVPHDEDADMNDVVALQRNYASVSVLQRDMTAFEEINNLNNWRIGK